MTPRHFVFALGSLMFAQHQGYAMCLPSETKNMACVVVNHTSPIMKTGKDILELSEAYKRLAKKMSEEIMKGHRPLHPVVKEALKGSHADIYILRLLCAKSKTFMTEKDQKAAEDELDENEPAETPK